MSCDDGDEGASWQSDANQQWARSAAKGNEYFCSCVCEDGLDYLFQMDVVHVGREASRKYFCSGMGATGYLWLA